MFEELFKQFPGLQNLYENAVANGYTGDPQQLLKEYGQDFQQNIGGLGSVLGITPQAMTQAAMPQQAMPMPQAMPQQMMPQTTMPMAQSLMTPSTPIVDPTMAAYQRSLLSGTTQPQNPYGMGLATSPYYGYPRNPYAGLLY
jgi:hypothetical protein